MPTYIQLVQSTQKGIETVKESPARVDAVKTAAQAMGVEIKALYLVTGRYDIVLLVEAPDDTTMAKYALASAARGTVRSETLRAFPEEDFRKIIAALP